jgi:hypothetical protein
MTVIMIVSGLFAMAALVATVLPFFLGRGGFLAAAGTINDPARLESMKAAIVARYVKEEVVFGNGDLSRREWARRQEYLRHRYIDVARRLDYLRRAGTPLLIGFFLLLAASHVVSVREVQAATFMGERHAIMLRGGVDQVWGHYVFTLQNDGKVAEEFTTPVMLPSGAIDVRPQEGVTPEEVVIGEGGQVAIRQKVEPGVHLVSFGFIVGAKAGNSKIEFVAPYPVQDLQILTAKGSGLEVRGPGLVMRRGSESPSVWGISGPVGVGEPLAFEVVGVAEGRQRLWIMGISVASLLIGLGGGLAWWGRPKRKEEFINEEALES